MSRNDAFEDVAVTVVGVTDRALRLVYGEDAPQWVPRSLCDDRADEVEVHEEVEIGVKLWKVIELGWLPQSVSR